MTNSSLPEIPQQSDTKKLLSRIVALSGNPNSGKSTIFNLLTGLRQKVANYPGVTVEKLTGRLQLQSAGASEIQLIDVPGTYSLAATSPDEYIAARTLFMGGKHAGPPDCIVHVLDASSLERGLYLLLQVMQVGCPVVVALNMTDVATKHGIRIDTEALKRELGVAAVVPMVANQKRGVDELRYAIAESFDHPSKAIQAYDPLVEQFLGEVSSDPQSRAHTRAELIRILFDNHGPAEKALQEEQQGTELLAIVNRYRPLLAHRHNGLAAAETGPLVRKAETIAASISSVGTTAKKPLSEQIDKYLLHPIVGPIFLLLLMVIIFQSVFSWAAPLMEFIDSLFASLSASVAPLISEGPLRSLVTDGIIGGVGSVLIFLPQIVILFLFISILEDSGYMPRAALLVDRMFGWCGLSGKSFIPMLSSFACAVPGVMATRTIEDRRVRFLTIMIAPLMSCSARLPVYTIMIAAFIPATTFLGYFNLQGVVLLTLYLLGLFAAVVISFVVHQVLFKKKRSSFLMELPSYKLPTLSSTLIRVYQRAQAFLFRAGTVILAITVIIWALSYYPHDSQIGAQYERQRTEIQEQAATRGTTLSDKLSRLDKTGLESSLESIHTASENDLASLTSTLSNSFPSQSEVIQIAIEMRSLQLYAETQSNEIDREEAGAYLRDSYFGRVGRAVEPVFVPLGWDWKITMAALASFPAREVVIATMGAIYNLGGDQNEESSSLIDKMRDSKWESGPHTGEPVFGGAVALSIMVFFALCCQCGATVVTIRQETGHVGYAILAFTYMTVLAYLGAFVVYQIFHSLGW